MAFEDLEDSPRSSTFSVALYVDGALTDTTQSLTDGVATLMFTPNSLASQVDLQVAVSGLYGQNVNWKVPKNATFLIDDPAPVLISTNVAPLDHRSTDMPLELTFEIGDRPVLPRHSLLHVETSWQGEKTIQLDQPANLNGFKECIRQYSILAMLNSGIQCLVGWKFSTLRDIHFPIQVVKRILCSSSVLDLMEPR